MPGPKVVPFNPDAGWDYNPATGQDEALARVVKRRKARVPKAIADAIPEPTPTPARQVPQFEEKKTAKEAAKWAVDAGLVDAANYGRLSADVANQMNRGLFDALQEFPALRGNQQFIGSIQEHNKVSYQVSVNRYIGSLIKNGFTKETAEKFAARMVKKPKSKTSWWAISRGQDGATGISFNDSWGKPSDLGRLNETLAKGVETGFHPPGTASVKAIIDHELGHQLDLLLGLAGDSEVMAVHSSMKSAGTIAAEVSGYAEKNIAEFIAEAWAEFKNNPAPRAAASRIGGIVRDRYSARFGP
jgi:hypothetical protein